MHKVIQATSRGQVTLPKGWRDQFDTVYYVVEIQGDSLVIKPLIKDDFKSSAENAWREYESGNFVTSEELMKKYGL